jgi:hypothetical protein
MLKERVEGTPMAGDRTAAADVPSGVLVGVSEVSVPAASARKEGTPGAAKHFAAACAGGRRR